MISIHLKIYIKLCFFQRCVDRAVSDKVIFSTFARTLPPSSKVSKSIISLLKHFNWDRLMLLVSEKHSHKETADELITMANKYNINIVETFILPGDYLTKDNDTLKKIVRDSYKRTRSKCHLNYQVYSK